MLFADDRFQCTRTLNRALVALVLLSVSGRAQPLAETGNLRVRSYEILRNRSPREAAHIQPDKCRLGVVAAAMRDRQVLTPPQRAALSVLQTRPVLQTSIVSGGFRVHFDTTGSNTPALLDSSHQRIPGSAIAYADSVASIASYVFGYETSVLGFAPPPSDGGLGGGSEYDIYIENLGSEAYGQTTPDNDLGDGGTSSTFIEIHNDFSFVRPPENKGLPAMRVTIAHEFHHAIQIGNYGFWFTDVWFHEITSVWMEDVVYHGVNDYLNYLFSSESQFVQPETPLTSNDFIMYSRGIWGKYLTKKFGRDAMLHIWQTISTRAPLPAIDYTLKNVYSSSLSVAFAEWALWNYFTGSRADTSKYYTEASLFPLIAETVYALNVPSQQVSGSLPCLSGTYAGFLSGADSVTVALTNINATCPSTGAISSSFTLTVSKSKIDNTYRPISGNLFLRLDVSDPSQWIAWDIERNGIGRAAIAEGSAYPNPFWPDLESALYMPADASEGNVRIYSTSMDLVYSAHQQVTSRLGQQVFVWNGRSTSGGTVQSGIYLFVLDLGSRTVTGKVALLRK